MKVNFTPGNFIQFKANCTVGKNPGHKAWIAQDMVHRVDGDDDEVIKCAKLLKAAADKISTEIPGDEEFYIDEYTEPVTGLCGERQYHKNFSVYKVGHEGQKDTCICSYDSQATANDICDFILKRQLDDLTTEAIENYKNNKFPKHGGPAKHTDYKDNYAEVLNILS